MANYPTFNGGIVSQRPYSAVSRFRTSGVDMETGQRHAYSWLANPLRAWELNYPMLTDAELATLRTFFSDHGGRFGQFTFTDPDTTQAHAKCRFGMDELDIQHLGPNQNSVRVLIEEYA